MAPCIGGVSGVCLTVSLAFISLYQGVLVIPFLFGGRRDDRNYAIGHSRQSPYNRNAPKRHVLQRAWPHGWNESGVVGLNHGAVELGSAHEYPRPRHASPCR
jgi:hypothetical protein